MSIFGDGLSVRLSARTRDFERGIDSAQRSLGGLGAAATSALGPLQALQGRADEAGDEIADVGRESSQASRRLLGLSAAAGATTGAFSALNSVTGPLRISLNGLANTPLLVILPALAAGATALLSTLVPLGAILGALTGGAFALTGAFGAIIGSGIIAFGEQRGEQNARRLAELRARIETLEALREETGSLTDAQEDELEALEEQADALEDQTGVMGGLMSVMADLREEIQPLIVEFGEQFVPLIEDAVDAIPQLVRNTLAAIGGFDTLVAALRAAGRTAFRVIPELVAGMFRLANRALPVAVDLFRWLLRNGGQVFQAMLRTTQRLAPLFLDFLDTLIETAPEVNRLGERTLNVLVPALGGLFRIIEDVMGIAQSTDSFAGFLATIIDNTIAWVQGPGRQAMAGLVDSVRTALITILNTGLRQGQERTGERGIPMDQLLAPKRPDTVVGAFVGFISRVLKRVAAWMTGGGQQQIENTLTALFDSLASILMNKREEFTNKILTPTVTILSGLFDALANALTSDEAGRLGTALGNLAGSIGAFFGQQLLDWFRSGAWLRFAGNILKAAVQGIAAVGQGFIEGAGLGGPVDPRIAAERGLLGPTETRMLANALRGAERNLNIGLEVEVNDQGVIEIVETRIEEENRSARRTGGRPGGV